MKKWSGWLLLLSVLLWLLPAPVQAKDEVEEVFRDGFYGGLAGLLVGAAFMAFAEDPGDHLANLYIGAGIGVLAGTTYGILKASRAFAEVDQGTVTVHAPTLRMELEPASRTAPSSSRPLWSVDLLRLVF
jgi:hypothetical protein